MPVSQTGMVLVRSFNGIQETKTIQENQESMINKDLLRRIRNDLPMAFTIAALGQDGPPSKIRDGRFFFLCPDCGEMQATVNPRNNLAHCFDCQANLNNIDLLMKIDFDFTTAVAFLAGLLEQHQSQRTKTPAMQKAK